MYQCVGEFDKSHKTWGRTSDGPKLWGKCAYRVVARETLDHPLQRNVQIDVDQLATSYGFEPLPDCLWESPMSSPYVEEESPLPEPWKFLEDKKWGKGVVSHRPLHMELFWWLHDMLYCTTIQPKETIGPTGVSFMRKRNASTFPSIY